MRKRGVERFVLFANSPPARLTRNGLTSGGEQGGSNLKPGAEGEFAKYLIDVAVNIRDECGLPHVAVAPINEPQWKWGEKDRRQEGCHYTPAEAAAAQEGLYAIPMAAIAVGCCIAVTIVAVTLAVYLLLGRRAV